MLNTNIIIEKIKKHKTNAQLQTEKRNNYSKVWLKPPPMTVIAFKSKMKKLKLWLKKYPFNMNIIKQQNLGERIKKQSNIKVI